MTAQMLDIDHSVYVAPSVEAPRRQLTRDNQHAERISRENSIAATQKRLPQVTPTEKLLARLLIELCASGGGAAKDSANSQADLAMHLTQFVPLIKKLAEGEQAAVIVTQELKAFFDAAHAILATCRLELSPALSDTQRQLLSDMLGQTASAYWWSCERQGLSGLFSQLPTEQILDMLDLAEQYARYAWIRYPARSRGLRYDDAGAERMVQVSVALR